MRAPSYNRTSWRINRPGQRSTDYYFMSAGAKAEGGGRSSIARAVALYRQATGEAPMPPKPILGFTMSKDRFKSQAEIITAAHGFRSGGFAVDTIVQDWFFWSNTPVDSSLTSYTNYGFDPSRYPSPPNLTKQLHNMHIHSSTSW